MDSLEFCSIFFSNNTHISVCEFAQMMLLGDSRKVGTYCQLAVDISTTQFLLTFYQTFDQS